MRMSIVVAALLGMQAAVSPSLAGDLAAGKAKAASACQTCHGVDGMALIPNAANLAGQQKGYLVIQLRQFRDGARKHDQMSIIARSLTDDDIENVAEWYSSIKVTVEPPDVG